MHTLTDTPALRARPSPDIWSALEYAAHVQDVLKLFTSRTALALETDNPSFPYLDQESMVKENGYNEKDPADVADGIRTGVVHYAAMLEAVSPGDWSRHGTRKPGERFSIADLARFATHEVRHHRLDAIRSAGRQAHH